MMALFTERLGKYKKGSGFKPRTEIKCFHCGKPGHYQSNCWHLKPELKPNANAKPENNKAVNHTYSQAEPKALFAAGGR
ncbi:zinc finger CCHC domain-containing protein, partial [Serratia marcescens]|uniref:zinc finger CCHC domain-containing protein n=1 Tax=Serratia marcescens TaxID=615 RepID=UPI0028146912